MSDIFETPRKNGDFEALLNALKNFDRSKGPTPNYQLCCHMLKSVFFDDKFEESIPRDDVDTVRTLISFAVFLCHIEGTEVPDSYDDLPISFIQSEDGRRYGYIVSLDDAKRECDCNFVGLMVVDGENQYYTSEYYALTNRFALCKFEKDGTHSGDMGEIGCYEDFKKALIG